MLGERACVDAVYSGYLLVFEPLGERAVGLPVGVVPRVVLRYDGAAVYAVALVVFADVVFLALWRYAVVAEDGVGGD